jgi:hypothetical protein
MKELVQDFGSDRRGGAPVKHISGCSKRLDPVSPLHGSMDKEGAKHTLSFAILVRSVGVGKAKQNAATGQEARHGVINELVPLSA